MHDALTGLPNRALFLQRLTQVVEQTKPPQPGPAECAPAEWEARSRDGSNPKTGFAVLLLDIDHFKEVNDSLGHLVGDQLLVAIARRLETCLRTEDTVARLGGDEFAILLHDVQNPQAPTEVAERIQTALRPPFQLGTGVFGGRGSHQVFTTASIGITFAGTSRLEIAGS